jgi:hypothetical protein
MASDRLPKVAHAERPRPDEKVLRQTGADLNNGWLARHGTLYLCEDRIVFVPTPLDTALRAKRREIALDDLEAVERWPARPGTMPQGGKRPRLILHAGGVGHEFLVPDLDGWFDLFEVILCRRGRQTGARLPEFIREGVENPLIEPEDRAPAPS